MKKILFSLVGLTYILSAHTSVTVVGSSTTVQQTVSYITQPSGGGGSSTPSNSSGNNYNRTQNYTSGGSGTYVPPPPPPIKLTMVYYSIFSEEDSKDGKRMRFNVAFSKKLPRDIVLNYEINPIDIEVGKDIKQTQKGSITVKKGSKSADIYLDVIDDKIVEDTENFELKIKKPAGNFKLENNVCKAMIIDNDQDKKPSSASGDYIINGGNPIDTQISSLLPLKLSIEGRPGFEVVTYDGYKTSKSCGSPSCSVQGNKQICSVQCTTTTYHVVQTSDNMNIDSIILHRFKEYDPVTNVCSQESSLILNDNIVTTKRNKNPKRHRNRYTNQITNNNRNQMPSFCSNSIAIPQNIYNQYCKTNSNQNNANNRNNSSYQNANSTVKYIALKSGGSVSVDVPLDTAYRCVYLEVFGHSDKDKNGNVTSLHGTSDTFAIRPKSYKINMKKIIVSGEDFDFNVNAFSNDLNRTLGYGQIQNSTFNVSIKDQIFSTCDLNITNTIFIDGISDLKKLHYDEVGILDIKIAENPSNYYAIVDASNSFIEEDTKRAYFIPKKFDVDYSIGYEGNVTFAMFSNSVDEMNSRLKLHIKALNAKNKVTKRYTKNGYSYDCNLTFDQVINKNSAHKMYYKFGSDEKVVDIVNNPKKLYFTLGKDNFIKGEFIGDIKESFSRVKNLPEDPIELDTLGVDIVDNNYTTVTGSKNSLAKSFHYYARAHVAPSPIKVNGTSVDANVFYEVYCQSCDKSVFTVANNSSSLDSVYWYIIPQSLYLGRGVCDIKNSIDSLNHDGNIISMQRLSPNKIEIKVNKTPYKNKIIYTPKYEYLLFDRVNSSVTNHKFIVDFASGNSVWAGEGNIGTTVDTNISTNTNMGLSW